MQTALNLHIRWMIRKDMSPVLDIEADSFEFPWLEDDFIRCLRKRNCIGMVAEHDEQVIGYMIYELSRNYIYLLNFVVAPAFRRQGVGRQMVKKLLGKMSPQRRRVLEFVVRERNVDAQLFFHAMGMKGVAILRGHYEDTGEDAYVFVHHATHES